MSEQKNKGQFDRLKDQYSKNKPQGDGPEKPKKRFNLYWIYAAIFIFFILLQMFSGMYSNVQDTNWHTVKNDFLINQEIEKIVVVNRRKPTFISKDNTSTTPSTKPLRNSHLVLE